jgi:hypothetical protein
MADAQIDIEATPKRFRRVERSSPTISTCFAYPQPISKSDVPHTSCILGCSLRAGDVPGPATPPGRLNLLLPTGEVRPWTMAASRWR